MLAAVGESFSHYRVIERIGAGGMGVVYRAEDTKLRRFVALKFLPPDLTRDEDMKRRFMVEAQAASALDHPNICTIYEIDETPDGQLFLAMAYYSGETLKQKISGGPLKVEEALDYAIQVTQGLAKAHAAGIVHRDVKPANVLVTTDGLVKIVDFGVAKLGSQTALTRTGTTLGTVAYMSPEQTRGELVDHRTDIWAIGVILYEMITGRLPFNGEDAVAVSYAVVHEAPPPISALRSGVPLEVERVVHRALEKRRDDRYQTAADLGSELRRLKRDSESRVAAGPRTSTVAPPSRKWTALIVTTIVAAVVLAAIPFVLQGRRRAAPVPELTNPRQITSATGIEDFPTWAPDGRALAYQSNETGNSDIWVRGVGAETAINRTADFKGNDSVPSWSPDGRQIGFWSARDGGGYFVMSALGGPPRRVLATGAFATGLRPNPPAWSHDSSSLACLVFSQEPTVEIVSLQTGESHRVTLPGKSGNIRMDVTWSPDERFFAYTDVRDITAQVGQASVLRLTDGKLSPITDGRSRVQALSWSKDSRTVYYTSNRGGSMDLWQQRVSDDGVAIGEAQPITIGLELMRASFSADGSKLVYSRGRNVGNVWSVPVLADRPATWTDARQLTFDEALVEFVAVSRDGRRLLVSSDKSGNPDLWMLPADGGDMQQLTTDSTPDWRAQFSPDGRLVGFYSYRSGNRDLWVIPVDGGRARQVTNNHGENYFGDWSPDGRNIVFWSNQSGSDQLWVVAADGGTPRRLTDRAALDAYPAWSRDGTSIAFASTVGNVSTIWRMPANGGTPIQLTKEFSWAPQWSPDSKWIYFTTGGPLRTRGSGNIWAVSVDGAVERQMTALTDHRGRMMTTALATDGQHLFFSWGEPSGHVWVMDVRKNDR